MELIEKLAALVPLPRMQIPVRYGGCSAPHNDLRGAIIPTSRQQGMARMRRWTPGRRAGAGHDC